MAIKPVQNEAVRRGNIIKASDLCCGITWGNSGTLGYQVYDTKSRVNNVTEDALYHDSTMAGLCAKMSENMSTYGLSVGNIIYGDKTLNWLKYCYGQLSRIRWCEFFYKNPNYDPDIIFSDKSYTLSNDGHVLLNDSKISMQKSNNGVPYGNSTSTYVKIACGSHGSKNFASDTNALVTFSGVNNYLAEFKKGNIISSDTINNTLTKFNSILQDIDVNGSKATQLSCTFSNAPGFGCTDDNYKIYLHFGLYFKTTKSVAMNGYNFGGNSNIFTDTSSFTNLQANGTAYLKKYMYDTVKFNLTDLGITGINFNTYKISGWFCVRTNSSKIADAIAELNKYVSVSNNKVTISDTSDNFEYKLYSKRSNNNFNDVKNEVIYVNLGKRGTNGSTQHYWLFPYMTGENISTRYCPLNNYVGNGKASDYKKASYAGAEAVMDKLGRYLTASLNTQYYGIKYGSGGWSLITSSKDLVDSMQSDPYDTYPLSAIVGIRTVARYGGNFKDSVVRRETETVKIDKQEYYIVKNLRVEGIRTYYTTSKSSREFELTNDAVDARKQKDIVKWINGYATWTGKRDWKSGWDVIKKISFDDFGVRDFIKFHRTHDDRAINTDTESYGGSSDTKAIFANAVIKTTVITTYPQI